MYGRYMNDIIHKTGMILCVSVCVRVRMCVCVCVHVCVSVFRNEIHIDWIIKKYNIMSSETVFARIVGVSDVR